VENGVVRLTHSIFSSDLLHGGCKTSTEGKHVCLYCFVAYTLGIGCPRKNKALKSLNVSPVVYGNVFRE